MPRATWNGFLRLSLVSCPIYLTPATSEAANIRLHQINPKTGNRVRQQLVDGESGDKVERADIVRGYEYERHEYVIIPDDELQELRIESSQTIDLDRFVKRDEIDPLYLDAPYFIYPDGKIAIETFAVIGAAMAETGRVGIGRIVLSSRERMVLVEPRGVPFLLDFGGLGLVGGSAATLRMNRQYRPRQHRSRDGTGNKWTDSHRLSPVWLASAG